DSEDDSSQDEDMSTDEEDNRKKTKKTTPKAASATKKTNTKDSDHEESDSDSEEEEEDEFQSPKKRAKKSTPASKKAASARKSTAKKSPAPKKRAAAKKSAASRSNAPAGTGGKGGRVTKAGVTASLTALSKKVLDNDHDTPETSLIAALLASTKPIDGIPSTAKPKQATSTFRAPSDTPAMIKIQSLIKATTTPQVDGIARHLVQNFEPNAMHVQLLNLMFRSVGGSIDTEVDEGTDLEELDDDEWTKMFDNVVHAMQEETDADQVLIAADFPPSPPHEQRQKMGLIAYRTVFKEFWYRLGHVILSHSPSSNTNTKDLMDDEEDSDSEDSIDSFGFESDEEKEKTKKKKAKAKPTKKKVASTKAAFTSNRFQLEMVRDLVSRLTEFLTIGQPDIRSCGTLAIFSVAKACVERSVELGSKIEIASRQFKAARQANSHSKMEVLRNKIDDWKRHKAELEEIVTGHVVQAAFIHRYRDANPSLRMECMDALAELSLIRPDIFLTDTYLKYYAWMTFDKKAIVRKAALNALLVPFKAHQDQLKEASDNRGKSTSPSPYKIDIAAMQHVTVKFLSRLVDCADDAQDVGVQELALKLLLAMVKVDFLDEVEDDNIWDSVNNKCFDIQSSPEVRKDALYFVLEQLDSFDTLEKHLGEKKLLERVGTLAAWIANILVAGNVPVDKARIELTDCVVESLLEIPEHKDIVLNWPVMVQAIRNLNQDPGTSEREEITKQRVILRMLVTSARHQSDKSTKDPKSGQKRKQSGQDEKDGTELSVALLQNLPSLFTNYQSDTVALRDVTALPQLVTSSVLGLPSRKGDFQSVLKSLCQCFLDSTDEVTLQNIALTLALWADGDHTRVSEVQMQLKRLSRGLHDKLMDRFSESDPENTASSRKSPGAKKKNKKKRANLSQEDSADIFSSSSEVVLEHSISLLLTRWRILLGACSTTFLFDDPEEDEEHEMEGLFNTISEAMGKRLKDRQPTAAEKEAHDDRTIATTSSFWKDGDPNLHEEVANNIDLALRVLLLVVAQELSDTLEGRSDFEDSESSEIDEDDLDIDIEELPVLKHRDAFVKLLIMCFDQYLEKNSACTNDQLDFAEKVQSSAVQVSSGLRTLFPHSFANATDPVRRALALHDGQDFAMLVGGFARWSQNRERPKEVERDDIQWVDETVTPLCRTVLVNVEDFYRREMALALTHMHGSGGLSNKTVHDLIKKIKKENPVRVLESHMACLRMAFSHWLETEPEDPGDGDVTDEDLAAYEDVEKRHTELFEDMEQLASKLSQSLGVAKLGNDYKRSFVSFMKEGVRFAFLDDGVYENGARLPFLSILVKYSSWIKKERDDLEELADFVLSKESELRSHPDFDDVHDDDKKALEVFKENLGIRRIAESSYYDDETTIATRTTLATPSPSSSRKKTPAGSSRRSVQSNVSNLSPLEEGDSDDEEVHSTPQQRRRLMSAQSTMSKTVVMEEEEQGSDSSGSSE
ncbi:MAG: hypothetical protein SGILL_003121, partial [Bacillariaceae sp.]